MPGVQQRHEKEDTSSRLHACEIKPSLTQSPEGSSIHFRNTLPNRTFLYAGQTLSWTLEGQGCPSRKSESFSAFMDFESTFSQLLIQFEKGFCAGLSKASLATPRRYLEIHNWLRPYVWDFLDLAFAYPIHVFQEKRAFPSRVWSLLSSSCSARRAPAQLGDLRGRKELQWSQTKNFIHTTLQRWLLLNERTQGRVIVSEREKHLALFLRWDPGFTVLLEKNLDLQFAWTPFVLLTFKSHLMMLASPKCAERIFTHILSLGCLPLIVKTRIEKVFCWQLGTKDFRLPWWSSSLCIGRGGLCSLWLFPGFWNW